MCCWTFAWVLLGRMTVYGRKKLVKDSKRRIRRLKKELFFTLLEHCASAHRAEQYLRKERESQLGELLDMLVRMTGCVDRMKCRQVLIAVAETAQFLNEE